MRTTKHRRQTHTLDRRELTREAPFVIRADPQASQPKRPRSARAALELEQKLPRMTRGPRMNTSPLPPHATPSPRPGEHRGGAAAGGRPLVLVAVAADRRPAQPGGCPGALSLKHAAPSEAEWTQQPAAGLEATRPLKQSEQAAAQQRAKPVPPPGALSRISQHKVGALQRTEMRRRLAALHRRLAQPSPTSSRAAPTRPARQRLIARQAPSAAAAIPTVRPPRCCKGGPEQLQRRDGRRHRIARQTKEGLAAHAEANTGDLRPGAGTTSKVPPPDSANSAGSNRVAGETPRASQHTAAAATR